MITLWLAAAVLQQTPMVEVRRERIEATPEQQQVLTAISRFGTEVGRCRRHLPPEQIAALEAGIASAPAPDQGGGQSILDQVFSASYARYAQNRDAQRLARDRCEVFVDDAAARLVAVEPLIAAVEAEMPPASARLWAGLVPASARAPGREARAVEPLARSSAPSRPNSVVRAASWARAPQLSMPSAARNMLNEGSAHIECIITVEGRARACTLLRESHAGMGLGEAALKAESDYRFNPQTVDGEPVEARATFTIRFRNEERVIEVD